MTESILDLDFGKVWFKENILIAELNEGILFDVENNRELLKIARQTFAENHYGYISFRNNSYAVNPLVYRESANIPNLKAIAVVTKDATCKNNAVLERQFYKNQNSFEIFDTLDDAIAWVNERLNLIQK